jgi:hypothetical protein
VFFNHRNLAFLVYNSEIIPFEIMVGDVFHYRRSAKALESSQINLAKLIDTYTRKEWPSGWGNSGNAHGEVCRFGIPALM